MDGADYSANSIEQVTLLKKVTITPTFTEGYMVYSQNGVVHENVNQKYFGMEIPSGAVSVIVRAANYDGSGLAFYSDLEGTTFISGFGANDNDLHTIQVPPGAVYLRYSYTKDARAISLGMVVVNSIDILETN